MKFIPKIVLVFLCLMVAAKGFAITKNDSIKLSGIVFNDKRVVRNLTIRVYDQNKLIKSFFVKRNNRFNTNIPFNSNLTVEISSPEFHTKRFAFDSHVPDNVKKSLKYHFDIDLFKEDELEGVNTSMLDFPVGLVYYDNKKEEFVRNKKYTKRMKKDYLKLWAESQSAERQGEGLE